MARLDLEWEQQLIMSQPKSFSDSMVFDILSRLPVRSIFRFKPVCEKWLALLEDPQFIEAQLNRSIERSDGGFLLRKYFSTEETDIPKRAVYSLRNEENFEELREYHFEPDPSCSYEIVASIDGIVCIRKLAYNSRLQFNFIAVNLYIMLWNPATGESRIVVPTFPGHCRSEEFNTCLGFGFDSKNNDYKVVGITCFDRSVNVFVYSLKNDSWTEVVELHPLTCLQLTTVHVNGRMHCLGSIPFRNMIVSFDFTEEKIIEMDVPEFSTGVDALLCESPASLGKSLVLCISKYGEAIQTWFMKDYGDSKSWTRLYSFPAGPIHRGFPVIFLDNGKFLLEFRGNLVLYDPKNQEYEGHTVKDVHGQVVKYRESLVSVQLSRSKRLKHLHL